MLVFKRQTRFIYLIFNALNKFLIFSGSV